MKRGRRSFATAPDSETCRPEAFLLNRTDALTPREDRRRTWLSGALVRTQFFSVGTYEPKSDEFKRACR
jgi:hypothetical protein